MSSFFFKLAHGINLYIGFQARVDRVHVEGLGRTKNDVVVDSLKSLFTAHDFTEVSTIVY